MLFHQKYNFKIDSDGMTAMRYIIKIRHTLCVFACVLVFIPTDH